MNFIMRCTIILTVAFLFLFLQLAQAANQKLQTPPAIGKMVDVGGYRVHLYCSGTGSPTVVIVGAGFSFDWGLVQPKVAHFTQVCTYDHSGSAWSDPGPQDSCSLRAKEVHLALKKMGISGPYVLVGHSLGALVARFYAEQYPNEVAGMVFVDHANLIPLPNVAATPVASSSTPMFATHTKSAPVIGVESDPNFGKLSPRDRELHQWAMTQPQTQKLFQTNFKIMPQCISQANAFSKEHIYSLGNRPLIDVSTNVFRGAEYVQLQSKLLSLSRNSKEIVADKSTHLIIIDQPDIVVDAINQVVQAVRNHAHLLPEQP